MCKKSQNLEGEKMKSEHSAVLSGKRVAFLSLGCKVNSYETEGMREMFLKAGAIPVGFEEEAEVYIVNTCSVTNIADRKSRQMLHRAKKRGNGAFVVAVGCYAQAAGDVLTKENGVDLVIGNNKKSEAVSLVADLFSDRETAKSLAVVDIAGEREYEELPIETVTEHTRAFIKIEDGCNQFCSYCIIPYVRGRVRSRSEKEVLAEVMRLAKEGYHEVVLTGIHLSSYGLEWAKNENGASEFDATLAKEKKLLPLLTLLQKVHEVEGIERIRLGSLEPRIMTEEFVQELAELPKLCPHFHLSLQSGCDATLRRMNRKYTTAEYEAAVQNLRKYFKNPAITTDIIVGFPGETEEEFKQTLEFAEHIAFSQIHIFKYSRRGGTVADRMDGQLGEQTKSKRSDQLEQVERRLEKSYREGFCGAVEELLVEEETEISGERFYIGHTMRYVKLAVPAEPETVLTNKTIRVRVTNEKMQDFFIAERLEILN